MATGDITNFGYGQELKQGGFARREEMHRDGFCKNRNKQERHCGRVTCDALTTLLGYGTGKFILLKKNIPLIY